MRGPRCSVWLSWGPDHRKAFTQKQKAFTQKAFTASEEVRSLVILPAFCPRSSLSAEVLTYLAGRLAHLLPPRPPGSVRGRWHPPLALEVRLDAVAAVLAAVLLDGLSYGLSYRRAGRMVGISKTEVGDSLDLLLAGLAALGYCQPDRTFITTLADLRERLGEMARTGEAVSVDGLATRVQRPRGWANQADGPTRRSGTTPNATPTPPGAWRCPPSMATVVV